MGIVKTAFGKPITLKTARVLIKREGSATYDDHSDAVGESSLIPATSGGSSWSAVNGTVIQDPGTETWSVSLGLAQDSDPDGFLRYLLAHSGEKAELRLKFAATDTEEAVLTITLSAAQFGGKAAEIATSSVAFVADGAPEFEAVIAA